jgi:hypothetical protein
MPYRQADNPDAGAAESVWRAALARLWATVLVFMFRPWGPSCRRHDARRDLRWRRTHRPPEASPPGLVWSPSVRHRPPPRGKGRRKPKGSLPRMGCPLVPQWRQNYPNNPDPPARGHGRRDGPYLGIGGSLAAPPLPHRQAGESARAGRGVEANGGGAPDRGLRAARCDGDFDGADADAHQRADLS